MKYVLIIARMRKKSLTTLELSKNSPPFFVKSKFCKMRTFLICRQYLLWNWPSFTCSCVHFGPLHPFQNSGGMTAKGEKAAGLTDARGEAVFLSGLSIPSPAAGSSSQHIYKLSSLSILQRWLVLLPLCTLNYCPSLPLHFHFYFILVLCFFPCNTPYVRLFSFF